MEGKSLIFTLHHCCMCSVHIVHVPVALDFYIQKNAIRLIFTNEMKRKWIERSSTKLLLKPYAHHIQHQQQQQQWPSNNNNTSTNIKPCPFTMWFLFGVFCLVCVLFSMGPYSLNTHKQQKNTWNLLKCTCIQNHNSSRPSYCTHTLMYIHRKLMDFHSSDKCCVVFLGGEH